MPPKPLIESRRARSAALATLMAAILVGALVAAHRLGGLRTVSVGDLSIGVPRRWVEISTPGAHRHRIQVYSPAPRHPMVLTISRLVPMEPHHPRSVLEVLQRAAVPAGAGKVHELEITPVRFGPLVGYQSAGIYVTATATLTGMTKNTGRLVHTRLMAVVTLDGSRYYAVTLSDLWAPSPLERFPRAPGSSPAPAPGANPLPPVPFQRELFSRVCSTMVSRAYRPADQEDLAAAGLSAGLPGHARALALSDTGAHEALRIVPDQGPATLRVMRVAREWDSGQTDPAHPLSPAALLRLALGRRFPQVHPKDMPTLVQVADRDVWRCTFPREYQPLAGHLWFVRRGDDPGALLELTCASDDLEAASRWANQVVKNAAASPPMPPGQAREQGPRTERFSTSNGSLGHSGSVFSAALERGRAIAQAKRDLLPARSEETTSYQLIEHQGAPVGCVLQRSGRLADDSSGLTLRGEATILRTDPGGRVRQLAETWACRSDGSQFWIRISGPTDPGAAPPGAPGADPGHGNRSQAPQVLVLEDNRLMLFRYEGRQAQVQWSMVPADPYYLPILEDQWPRGPIEQLRDARAPAIVWMSRGTRPPTPCWVEARATAGTEMIELCIRPLMALDADRAELDGQGSVTQYAVQDDRGTPTDNLLYRRVERARLIKALPWIEKHLRAWEHHTDD